MSGFFVYKGVSLVRNNPANIVTIKYVSEPSVEPLIHEAHAGTPLTLKPALVSKNNLAAVMRSRSKITNIVSSRGLQLFINFIER